MKVKKKIVITTLDLYQDTSDFGKVVSNHIKEIQSAFEKNGRTPKRITIELKFEDEISDSGIKNVHRH